MEFLLVDLECLDELVFVTRGYHEHAPTTVSNS
jgi:hypothetical protein